MDGDKKKDRFGWDDVADPIKKKKRSVNKKKQERSKLFEYDDTLDNEDPNDPMNRVFRTTETARKGHEETLRKADQALDRIGEIGDRSLDRLATQRNKIENAIENVNEIQADGTIASQRINRMRRKKLVTKLVLLCFIIVLLLGVLIVVYFGLIKPFLVDPFTSSDKKKD